MVKLVPVAFSNRTRNSKLYHKLSEESVQFIQKVYKIFFKHEKLEKQS